MKKNLLISLLLSSFMLVGCGEEDKTSGSSNTSTSANSSNSTTSIITSSTGGEINEEIWNEITSNEKFENVTFELNAHFVEKNAKPADESCYYKYLLDGDKGIYYYGYDATEYDIAESDEIEAIRSLFIDISLSIIENLNDFNYSVEEDRFLSNKTISIDVEVMGEEATLINENVEVELNDQNQILSINCDMIQDFKGDDITRNLVLDVEFIFSNYGTTVVPIV